MTGLESVVAGSTYQVLNSRTTDLFVDSLMEKMAERQNVQVTGLRLECEPRPTVVFKMFCTHRCQRAA